MADPYTVGTLEIQLPHWRGTNPSALGRFFVALDALYSSLAIVPADVEYELFDEESDDSAIVRDGSAATEYRVPPKRTRRVPRPRLEVEQIILTNPGLLSFKGLAGALEQLRLLIKDLRFRNRYEEMEAKMKVIDQMLHIREKMTRQGYAEEQINRTMRSIAWNHEQVVRGLVSYRGEVK